MARVPRKLLLNDEGNSALHYLDLDEPARSFTCEGPGRDLQLVGGGVILRSTPQGYAEIDLDQRRVVRSLDVAGLPGAVESARRLPSGHTSILGNGPEGIFVWELDTKGAVVPDRRLLCQGAEKGRLLRFTEEETFLFCSDTAGKRLVHEASFSSGTRTLFEVPVDVAADSMVKAVRLSRDVIALSSGYAGSLLIVDTLQGRVLQRIGGKAQAPAEGLRRPLNPHFFSGYQRFDNGDFLIANWQGHGRGHGKEGYQLLQYDAGGKLLWCFDQSEYAFVSSLNNVIALDDLDVQRLHDERGGVLVPVAPGQ
jgi:hypothetical protein